MVAAIEEVRTELHLIQNRVRVLRLSLAGIGVESNALANANVQSAARRCHVVSDELDALNDDLTRAAHAPIP